MRPFNRAVACIFAVATPLCLASPPQFVIGLGDNVPTSEGDRPLAGAGVGGILNNGSMVVGGGVIDSQGNPRVGRWIITPWGSIQSLLLFGDPVPGIPGATCAGFNSSPRVSGNTLVDTAVVYKPGSPTTQAGFAGFPAPYGVVAGFGLPAPGVPGASHYACDIPQPTATGFVQFVSSMQGVSSTADHALWQYGSNGTRLVAQEGDAAPGTGGSNFNTLNAEPVATIAGRTVFSGTLRGTGVATSNRTAMWRETSTGLELVHRHNSIQAPGYVDGAVFGSSLPVFARDGNAAVLVSDVRLGGTTLDVGVWIWNGGYSRVLRLGEPINNQPDARLYGGIVSNTEPHMTSGGIISLSASTLNAQGVSQRSFLRGTASGFEVLFHTSQQAPELAPGVLISGWSIPQRTDTGMFAVAMMLNGAGVSSSNDVALYAFNDAGTLELIVRLGDLFEYKPGQMARITNMPGTFGYEDAVKINDLGRLFFSLTFDNGFTGLYTIQVPAPGGVAAVLAMAMLSSRPRRRERAIA